MNPPRGYVNLTLHAHLPYVVNHGTWPHGLEWLCEAAAETYLPLLRVFADLEREGIALKCNINLSPVLLEQLSHPVFKEELPNYLQRKIDAARADQRSWSRKGESRLAAQAVFWEKFFEHGLAHFERLNRDIIGGFRHFHELGAIEVFTCAATHGYFPLLGSDANIRAQVKTGVATHIRHLGRKPRGIWLPECGYRPAGEWTYPVRWKGAGAAEPFLRAGVEEILAESGLEYFFIDTHLVESAAVFTPYEHLAGGVPVAIEEIDGREPRVSFYQPFYADTANRRKANVAFFTRDPRTSVQVWSGDHGYPGDGHYLEFHKKHWPGGHRYWRVTGPKLDLGAKTAYVPEEAAQTARGHAHHFRQIAPAAMAKNPPQEGVPGILTAPFDAELFGHWWFEGPQFLAQVAREFSPADAPLRLTTCGEYLDRHRPKGYVSLEEGSWGANGNHHVWLNKETAWTWTHIYPAEEAVRAMARSKRWAGHQVATRLAKQICRELLLLESSDWQFLITTGAAADYATQRFHTHREQLATLLEGWRRFEATGQIPGDLMQTLELIEARDGIFAEIQPEHWAG
jgi:1,4-alpha-glucan branching enzyme